MEEVLDLEKIFILLKKNLMSIIGLAVLGAIIAALISFFLITPIYTASTQILVNKSEGPSQMEFQANQTDLQLINTYSEIIKSPVILDEVKENLKLKDNLIGKVAVTNTTQSKVITLTVSETSNEKAVKIANEITQVFKNKINKIMKVDNVTVLNKAIKNDKALPVKPQPILNIIIGLFAGAILAILIGFLKEVFDKRIQNDEDVQNVLNIPVIGSIPHFDEKSLKN
ncbi:Wzz/FepE/Etk N-terminal domain-containing protein [Macrococcus capreoli]|uniref:YveK family protein n=1 Tax=Macrococcus capreoli TaxID=2982690 RepID=UPI0021D57B27|nr:Wzz/FepE/Etk N-terminal domain-containing protein [Macrococcus sp. TMW 2.2395]MCU7557536.1 Wzz/FepE/Etk N-terminal domain-containing protein [Macrococcus sp. TMW 2.2395]